MWNTIASVCGLIGAIVVPIALFIVKRTLDGFKDDIKELKEICKIIPTLDEKIENHSERLDSITRDHSHLEDSLEKLSDNLSENSTVMGGIKESINGLRELLQNIIQGNLIIKKR